MTSNIGSEAITQTAPALGFAESRETKALSEEKMRSIVEERLRATFKPEFLNRIDDTVIFHPLSQKVLLSIVDLQLNRVTQRLSTQGIRLHFTDKLKKWLVQKGYDPLYGARPLKRLIQTAVLDPLALDMLGGKVAKDEAIEVTEKNGKVVFVKMKN